MNTFSTPTHITPPRPGDLAQGSNDRQLAFIVTKLGSDLISLQESQRESDQKFERHIGALLQKFDALEAKVAVLEKERESFKQLVAVASKRETDTQPQVRFVPVFVPEDQDKSHASTHSADAMFPPVPPNPSSPPAVRFDQDGPDAVFLNYSPHRVVYLGVVYPTAAHLFEAFKFIDQHPDIAAKIRSCPDVHALYDLTNRYSSSIRPDWGYVHLEYMNEVLFLKFKQHPDLRLRLLGTGDARIIYTDQNDTFWGTGSDESGQNLLGKALVRAKEILRTES